MNKIFLIAIIVLIIIVAAVIWYMYKPSVNPESNNQTTFDIQGMKVEILQQGTGEVAKTGDNVLVNYIGTLSDGTKFDSSYDRKDPFLFALGQNMVIKGWELGVVGMKVGEKRRLTIPPALGYGDQNVMGVIPANSTLIFEVELMGIVNVK